MADTIYSKSSNLSTSVQKRRTLYLAESDPRANKDFITKYMNDYYAEVVVLSDAKYMSMLASELGMPGGKVETYTEVPPNTVLHAPTALYWDYKNDPSATKFVTVNGSNYVNIKVSFDPGDNMSDSLQYEYYVDTTGTGANPGSTSTSNGPIDKTTIHFSHYYNAMIEASWAGISDAIGYTVTVKGVNCPPREYYQQALIGPYAETAQKSYYLNYDPSHPSPIYNSPGYVTLDSNGKATFKIVPVSGKTFSGSYVVTIAANYTDSTSTVQTARFTIGGGAPTID